MDDKRRTHKHIVIRKRGNMSERIELFVPGRLCLFGEHSDWAGLHRNINSAIIPGEAIEIGRASCRERV